MPTAIKLAGRVGRHSFIDDTYEPMTITHNNKPVWVARSVAPRYLYHSGKARWVLNKTLDDGHRCWAYVSAPANSQDPSMCSGVWQICDHDGEWRPDPKLTCTAVAASSDKFVQLRMSLDEELQHYGLVNPKHLKELWSRLDYNGNGIVSLAEIDKMVVELCESSVWPTWLNNKPALMRAYKKTTLKNGNGDDWVQSFEFHALLLNIFWFNKLWQVFDCMDSGDDRRINVNEFMHGMSKLGLHLSNEECQAEFDKIDQNHGGQVLFVEFCGYIRSRLSPDAHAEFDADLVSGEHCGKTLRKHHGHEATANLAITKKSFAEFDNLEKEIKRIIKDKKKLRKLWNTMDYNGNRICSLAEIDKLMVENYPLLNHKPALMRAYKKTIREGKDDWVHRNEFKALLANVFYFNKLWWLFMDCHGADQNTDRRMTLAQFRWTNACCGIKMTDDEARREFNTCDKNRGGMILFDEYCTWFAGRSCPEGLQDLILDE